MGLGNQNQTIRNIVLSTIMNQSPYRLIKLFTLLSSCLIPISAKAQITPDGTLPNNSVVTPDGETIQIDGGTTRGGNLFHSFQEFSVPAGSEAMFNNANAIDNIFSRVTGGAESIIDGGIGANGAANVFLINPAGIIFGEGAFLNIGGSFIGSTANDLLFPDGVSYSATDTDVEPVLTINAPIGLGFREEPQPITNLSIFDVDNLVGLRAAADETIALIGGDILLEGGFISSVGGRIELGSVGENNTVNLTEVERGFNFSYEGVENFQDISLTLAAFVSNEGIGAGDIELQGRNISLIEGSEIAFENFEGGVGSLTIIATDSIGISGNAADVDFGDFPSSIRYSVGDNAIGENSILSINTNSLNIDRGGLIVSETIGSESGVNVNIEASEIFVGEPFVFDIDDFLSSGIFAQVDPGTTGDGGNVSIKTERLSISDGGQINAVTFGSGNAGNISLNVTESINLTGTVAESNSSQFFPSGVFASVAEEATATGDGGDIIINTSSLTITDGAQIGTFARNEGNGGALTINATDSIRLSGFTPTAEFRGDGISGISVSADPSFEDESGTLITTTGNGGTLNLTTEELIVEQGAAIFSDTLSLGNGGDINLNVDRLIVRDGGEIRSGSLLGADPLDTERGAGGTLDLNVTESVEITGTGNINGEDVQSSLLTTAESNGAAGNLSLVTDSLNLSEGGQIDAGSTGEADAGDLSIEAGNIEILDLAADNFGTGILAEVAEGAAGTGGNIAITAEQLTVNGSGASISVGNRGVGNAGDLTIDTSRLIVDAGAQVSASTFGEGNAGNLTVNATESVELSSSEGLIGGLFAQVNPGATGTGGSLNLTTGNLSIRDGGRVQVSTFGQGDAGQLTVDASNIDVFRTFDGTNGTGIFAEVSSSATGTGGDVVIDTNNLNASDRTRISVGTFGVGDAGNLTINTERLTVATGAQISASTFGEGNANSLTINATDSVELSSSEGLIGGLFAQVNPEATGTGGSLNLTTGSLNIRDGGRIQVSTFGQGNAGELAVNANNINLFRTFEGNNATGIFAQVRDEATGDGGNVEINTSNLTVNDGTEVSVATLGEGDAGELNIDASNAIAVRGISPTDQSPSQISVDASPESTGEGGNLQLAAEQLDISNGGQISATTGNGTGGNITLDIDSTINLSSDSLISAAATGTASGGNININTDFIVATPDGNNDIVASAGEQGTGGNINIDADSVFGLDARPQNDATNDIDASGGVAGQVIINTPDTDITQGIIEVPQNVVESEQTVAQVCRNNDIANNSFVIEGKGGIPPEAIAPLNSDNISIDGQVAAQTTSEPLLTAAGEIMPARGVIKTPAGKIILTAYPTVNNRRVPEGKVNCAS